MKTSNCSIFALLVLGFLTVSSVNAQYHFATDFEPIMLKGGDKLFEDQIQSPNYNHFDRNSRTEISEAAKNVAFTQNFQNAGLTQFRKNENGPNAESALINNEILVSENSFENLGFVDLKLEMEPWMKETSWIHSDKLNEEALVLENWMTAPENWIAGNCR